MEGVREAGTADLERLVRLVEDAIAELTPMRGGRIWALRDARRPPLLEALAEELADEARRVVVGTIDDAVMGYGVAGLERLSDGSLLGVVHDLFVEEGARGVGVGEAMIGDLVAWCRSREVIGIDAMALPGHRAAKNFFEQQGFTARQIVMHAASP
ncbi:MAG: GNAT family N-acetyltransferase [Acidimicrobiales bacterium]